MNRAHYVLFFLLGSFLYTLHAKPPALNNFGVSCYFNSVIQALNATKPLINVLPKLKYHIPDEIFPQKFKSLLKVIQNNEFEQLEKTLKSFYDAIVDKITKLQGIKKTNNLKKDVEAVIRQEDASEFLILLINELNTHDNEVLINDIFYYQENVDYYKPGEDVPFRFNKEQPNNLLSIPVFTTVELEGEEPYRFNSSSVEESLDMYFKKEEVFIKQENKTEEKEQEEDLYELNFLQRSLNKASEILIITLKRFYFESKKVTVFTKEGKEIIQEQGTTKKFQSAITIPLDLNLEKYCTENVINPHYELYAVVNHRGDRASSGHYIAYVKENNTWYSCNDSNIQKVEFKKVKNEINKDGYILFYQQKSEETESEEEVNIGLRKKMKEGLKKELERIEKGKKALEEKIKVIKQKQEEEKEAESLKLAQQLEAEELEAEKQRLQEKYAEEQRNLEKALEISIEQQRFPESEQIRQQQIKQQKEREEVATQELIRKLQEEDLARLEAERQKREQETKKSEEEAFRLAVEQQESYYPEIEQRRTEEIKRKQQETSRKEQDERAQIEIKLEKERKERAELTRLEKQRIEIEKHKAQRKKYDEQLIHALNKLNNSLQQMLSILKE